MRIRLIIINQEKIQGIQKKSLPQHIFNDTFQLNVSFEQKQEALELHSKKKTKEDASAMLDYHHQPQLTTATLATPMRLRNIPRKKNLNERKLILQYCCCIATLGILTTCCIIAKEEKDYKFRARALVMPAPL